jgi:hypothetical protein
MYSDAVGACAASAMSCSIFSVIGEGEIRAKRFAEET